MANQEKNNETQNATTLDGVVDEPSGDTEETINVDDTSDAESIVDEEVSSDSNTEQNTSDSSTEDAEESEVDTQADDTMSAMLEELIATQKKMQKDFQEKLKYDEHKEQVIDTLHRELQQYKDDMIKSTIKPLVNDLIMMNDNIYKLVDNLRAAEEGLDPEKILEHMEFIITDIDDVLFRQGIEPYTCIEEKVNLRKQSIFQTVPINDQSKEKHIAKQVRKGYEWDERILRKELVSVYVYDDSVEEQVSIENEATDKNKNEGAN